jgi:hypothetical protein
MPDGPSPGDYLLLSDTQRHADRAAADAARAALQDDAGFRGWMAKVGDPGVVTAYVSARALPLLAERARTDGRLGGHGADTPRLKVLYQEFKGMAGVVRFSHGALEAEFVGQGLPGSLASAGDGSGPGITKLPTTTAAAVSVTFRRGWLERYLHSLSRLLGDGVSVHDLLAQGEAATGLRLPQDAETLLGNGVTVSLDGADLPALTRSPDPRAVPAAVRIDGDPTRITAIIDKLRPLAGPAADSVVVRTGPGVVGLGLDEGYVNLVVKDGGLGDSPVFRAVVPDAARASTVLYVNLDAGHGWAEQLGDLISNGDPKVKANLAPLAALGVSSWADNDQVQHGLARLTTN